MLFHTDSQTDIFFELVIFLFNAEGFVSEKEREVLSTYLRYTSREAYPEDMYEKLLYSPPSSPDSVLKGLKNLPYEARFFALLQAFSLLLTEEINQEEYQAINIIINGSDLNSEDQELLRDLFVERNYKNNRILFIGNDSAKHDIVKTKIDIDAAIILAGEHYYMVAFRSEGLIRLGQQNVFDFIVYDIQLRRRTFIDEAMLSFSAILIRMELKQRDDHTTFSIMKTVDDEYKLVREEQPDALGFIYLSGCHMVVYNVARKEKITIGSQTIDKNIYTGSIDDQIVIGDKFFFNLSSKLSDIVSIRNISSDVLSEKKIVIGNAQGSDIYLSFFSQLENSITIYENELGQWELDSTHNNLPLRINNKPVDKKNKFVQIGDVIQMERKIIIFDPNNITVLRNNIFSIEGNEISFSYESGKTSLSNVSFRIESRNICCIMGPSGCGKSTLVNLLAGYLKPSNLRSVLYNGLPLYENFEHFKYHIGYVSQDDLLFENLSVYENLYHYGRLKVPYIDVDELNRRIENLLSDLGLTLKRNLTVGNQETRVLSGGERKRLNIALELLTDSDVLILDEPTSGLSSYDTKKTIDLLEYHASLGKIIFVVIHQPSKEIFSKFTHLMLLDKGGYLAYFGAADRSYEYFKRYSFRQHEQNSPDLLIEILEAVRQTPSGEIIYEYEKGSKVPMRVKTPKQWHDEYRIRKNDYSNKFLGQDNRQSVLPKKPAKTLATNIIRFGALFFRNFKNKFRDIPALIISFVMPTILGTGLALFLRISDSVGKYHWTSNRELPKFLFLSSIILIFLGVSNSISEIFKDRVFLTKEKLVGYSGFSYLLSKFCALAIITFYQTFLYCLTSFLVLSLPILIVHNGVVFVQLFLAFFLFSFVAGLSVVTMGLFFSSFIHSEKVAFYAVPLIIIPQIILGGMFINFNALKYSNEDLKPYVPPIANVIHSRWIYESYLNILRYNNAATVPEYRNIDFYNKYGNQNNDEILSLFRSYNMSDLTDEKLNEKRDADIREIMRRYFSALANYEAGDYSLQKFNSVVKETGKNYFLYYKKELSGKVISAVSYNYIALIIIMILFFVGTIVKLEVDKIKRLFRFGRKKTY